MAKSQSAKVARCERGISGDATAGRGTVDVVVMEENVGGDGDEDEDEISVQATDIPCRAEQKASRVDDVWGRLSVVVGQLSHCTGSRAEYRSTYRFVPKQEAKR